MSDLMLRLYDGYAHTSLQLRDTVRELQAMLRRHDRAVVVDGLFGRGTEQQVRSFQRARGLRGDGVVGPETWHALLDPDAPPSDHLATTYPLDHPVLLDDLEAAARYGATVVAAAGDFGLPPAVIVALGSRESRWGLALSPKGPTGTADPTPRPFLGPHRTTPLPPDRQGFGRGLMQVDYDRHEFARSGPWHEPDANVRHACAVLVEFRPALRRQTVPSCARPLPPTAAVSTTCCARSVPVSISISTPLAASIRARSSTAQASSRPTAGIEARRFLAGHRRVGASGRPIPAAARTS
jgi:Putative peptidoglycan binding domain